MERQQRPVLDVPTQDFYVERLLPRIFDDVERKGWHGVYSLAEDDEEAQVEGEKRLLFGNFDTSIVLQFIERSLMNPEDHVPISPMTIFSLQKERMDELMSKI